jgi:hypothetical protein
MLSHTLLAFTIEFDNEWERQMSEHEARRVLLTSLVMWANFMRFVGDEGVRIRTLAALARVSEDSILSRVAALERSGHVVVEPNPEFWSRARAIVRS